MSSKDLKADSLTLNTRALPSNPTDGQVELDLATGNYKRWHATNARWEDFGPDFDTELTLAEIATPSNPSSGDRKFYVKSDGNLYTLDANGVEVPVGSGSGAGEKNYVENPSAESNLTGWLESSSGAVDITRSNSAAELPREFTTGTGLKIVGTAAATGEYVSYRFSLDDVDQASKLKISFSAKTVSGYADGDFIVKMFTNAQSDYLGAYTEIVFSDNSIIEGDRNYLMPFDASESGIYYELRVEAAVATSNGVVISDVVVGPGLTTNTTLVTGWVDFTPEATVSSDWTFSDLDARYRRVGDTVEVIFSAVIATSTGLLRWDNDSFLPGLTLAEFNTTVGDARGVGFLQDLSAGDAYILAVRSVSDDLRFVIDGVGEGTQLSATAPVTVQDGTDRVSFRFSSRVTEWTDQGTANIINDRIAEQNSRFHASDTAAVVIANNAVVPLSDTEKNVGGGSYNAGTGEYTAPSAGDYLVSGSLRPGGTTAGAVELQIRVNNTTIKSARADTTSTNGNVDITAMVTLAKDDLVKLNLGAVGFTTTANPDENYFQVIRIADYTAGQAVGFGNAKGGEYGLVSYDKDDLDISSSGDFNAAQSADPVRVRIVNDVVTMTIPNLQHSSDAAPETAAGFIPTQYRPTETVTNTYFSSTLDTMLMVHVEADGTLRFSYYASGATTTRTNNLPAVITYVL